MGEKGQHMRCGFSYRRYFRGDTIMVVVPHEDDEINIAGSLICGAREEGLRVLCVFLTNGDYDYIPDVRIHEARRALQVLGVPAEDVIFLGYPDGGAHGERCVFYRRETLEGKIEETRGASDVPEFFFMEHGRHHAATWNHLLDDLKEVILKYEPDGLIAVDFDVHPDHRMCSIAFETVMGEMLNRRGNTYRPAVLKAFAYNTAFEGREDFYRLNLLSTEIHAEKLLAPDSLDNPSLEWARRVRLPVPADCRTQDLTKNRIFQALTCHLSQKAMRRAERMINSDQVFWEKRTDNLLFQGKISVSSGDSRYLHDFRTIGMIDISSRNAVYGDYLWQPAKDETRPWCRCDFAEPRDIGAMVIHGNVESDSRIVRCRIQFSNGFVLEVGPLCEKGRPTELIFPVQHEIQWVRLDLLAWTGDHAGVAEWEVFSSNASENVLLAVCADGHFAGEWIVSRKMPPQIGVYNPSRGNVVWYMNGKRTELSCIQAECQVLSRPMIVKAILETCPDVWDEIVFLPETAGGQIARAAMRLKSRMYSWWENQREKRPHHQLRKFRNGG